MMMTNRQHSSFLSLVSCLEGDAEVWRQRKHGNDVEDVLTVVRVCGACVRTRVGVG